MAEFDNFLDFVFENLLLVFFDLPRDIILLSFATSLSNLLIEEHSLPSSVIEFTITIFELYKPDEFLILFFLDVSLLFDFFDFLAFEDLSFSSFNFFIDILLLFELFFFAHFLG